MRTSFVGGYATEDGSSVVLLHRDDRGQRVETRYPAEYVVYLDDLDREHERKLASIPAVRSLHREGPWVRIGMANHYVRDELCFSDKSPFVQQGIKTYEGDVDPLTRWLVDHRATILQPRRCYLDIETDSRVNVRLASEGKARVLCWSLTDDDGCVQARLLAEDTDEAEDDLLRALWAALEPYDQVCAWSGDDFDFPVIWKRSRRCGIAYAKEQWLWLDHLALFRRMNLNASESADEKRSMKLHAIAVAVCGEGKDDLDARHTYEAWRDDPGRLLRYNIQDVELERKIEEKTGYIALFQSLCEACHIFGDTRGLNPTRQMDSFMFVLGLERGHHFPSKRYFEFAAEKFKGAFVMKPECSGVVTDVHVGDFSGMYPSIMLSWNMSPETKRVVPVEGPLPEGICCSPLTGVCFDTTVEGILHVALTELIRLRKKWNDIKQSLPPGTPEWQDAHRKSTAYKVAANSFYGVVGSPYSRFFDRDIGESVTQNGVWLIRKTMEAADARGWNAIYGDTDSVFIVGCTAEEFGAFVKWCNEKLYPPLLLAQGCAENHVKLAYEKELARLVMVTAKRYCASYKNYKGKAATTDSKPEVKGLEYKRGDAALLACQLQAHVIDMLVGGLKIDGGPVPTDDLGRYHEVVSRAQQHVLEDELPLDEVVLSQSLSKPLKEYVTKVTKDGTAAAQPAHVRVAKVLEQRGAAMVEGTRVEYVVTDASDGLKCIPAEDYTGVEVDRYYVWESRVWPPTERLLQAAYPAVDWSAWGRVRPRYRHGKAPLPGQLGFAGVAKDVPVRGINRSMRRRPTTTEPQPSPIDVTKAAPPPVPTRAEVEAHEAADPTKWDTAQPPNEKIPVRPDIARIVEKIFINDADVAYEKLEKVMRIGEGRTDYAILMKALDEAETNARVANRLWLTAKVERARWEMENEEVFGTMRMRATAELQREKAAGERNKAISEKDITSMAAVLFGPEWRHQQVERARVEATEESLKHLSEIWVIRCKSLQAMLSKHR